MHNASNRQSGHIINELNSYGLTVILNNPIKDQSLECPNTFLINGTMNKLSISYYHIGITFTVLFFTFNTTGTFSCSICQV